MNPMSSRTRAIGTMKRTVWKSMPGNGRLPWDLSYCVTGRDFRVSGHWERSTTRPATILTADPASICLGSERRTSAPATLRFLVPGKGLDANAVTGG